MPSQVVIGRLALMVRGLANMRIYEGESSMVRRLRRMYAGGQGNRVAKAYARLWATVFRWGLLPRRWVTLEVVGRRSGEVRSFPLGMVEHHGQWFLVSMLGECAWVRNVRAAGGEAVLARRGRRRIRLSEIPVAERPEILRDYLRQVPGGRPHVRVALDAPLSAYAAVAADHPVFAVMPAPAAQGQASRA